MTTQVVTLWQSQWLVTNSSERASLEDGKYLAKVSSASPLGRRVGRKGVFIIRSIQATSLPWSSVGGGNQATKTNLLELCGTMCCSVLITRRSDASNVTFEVSSLWAAKPTPANLIQCSTTGNWTWNDDLTGCLLAWAASFEDGSRRRPKKLIKKSPVRPFA